MHDSRSGGGLFFRYHPRDIQALSEGKLGANIRIHASAIERLTEATADYAPRLPPATLDIEREDGQTEPVNWAPDLTGIRKMISLRKELYFLGVIIALANVIWAIYLWNVPPCRKCDASGLAGHLEEILHYLLPTALEGWATAITVVYPHIGLLLLVVFVALYLARSWLQSSIHKFACADRARLLAAMQNETQAMFKRS